MVSGTYKYFLAPLLAAVLALFWNVNLTAPDPTTVPNLRSSVSIVAVGDILLSRHVGARIDQQNNPSLPFEQTAELLREADLVFGNLECPLSDSDIPVREGLIFKCLAKYVPGLTSAGFDVLSTANNHSFDQGLDNIGFTVEYLLETGILPVGTGRNEQEARAGKVIERNNTKVGFLAYSYTARNDGGKSRHPQIATTHNLNQLQTDIASLKAESDIIIVSMHAGIEYVRNPNQEQVNFARAAIDAGADAVIGHHPHWIQIIEIYQDKPIFYSLGNFVFDQMWSQETREGLIVRLEIRDKRLEMAQLVPVIIDNFCCPRLANDEEKDNILEQIGLETDVIKFDNE